DDRYVETSCLHGVDHTRGEREMPTVVHREPDGVGVLLFGGGDDRLRRLAQPEIDDFESCVTQHAGDDLQATVVSVETEFGEDDALAHHAVAFSVYEPKTSSRAETTSPSVASARTAEISAGIVLAVASAATALTC